ncbi:hypothetical protein D3C72_2293750 [compost metagenome]
MVIKIIDHHDCRLNPQTLPHTLSNQQRQLAAITLVKTGHFHFGDHCIPAINAVDDDLITQALLDTFKQRLLDMTSREVFAVKDHGIFDTSDHFHYLP